MKTTKRTISYLAYGLCLATVLYNCKTKEVDSVTPFTYTFKGLDNVALPDVKPTAPAAVSVTAATVTVSQQAAVVSDGLKNIAATGQVPTAVKEAADNVGKAVSADKASSLVLSFTPDVVNTLTSTGKLPASLQADVSAIASNPALKAYMPTYTLPQINGKPVGGRLGAAPNGVPDVVVVTAKATTDGSTDACKLAATAAYNSAVTRLDATKATQTAAVNAAYTQAEAAANAEVPGCQSSLPTKYSTLVASVKTGFDANMASLAAAKTILGELQYNQLLIMNYVAFSQILRVYNTLLTAETNACALTKDAKINAAKAARDADLNAININYNTTVGTAVTARDKAIAGCHNQGNGG